jgi:hypothetical protein
LKSFRGDIKTIKTNRNHAVTIWVERSQTKQESCDESCDDTCCEEFCDESCDDTCCEEPCDKNKMNRNKKTNRESPSQSRRFILTFKSL